MKAVKHLLVIGMVVSLGLSLNACLADIFNPMPTASLKLAGGDPYGPVPCTITFDISGSKAPYGEIVSFSLDFGDGTPPFTGTDLTQPIVHTYETPGTYIARLTVTDDRGRSSVSPGLVISPKEGG